MVDWGKRWRILRLTFGRLAKGRSPVRARRVALWDTSLPSSLPTRAPGAQNICRGSRRAQKMHVRTHVGLTTHAEAHSVLTKQLGAYIVFSIIRGSSVLSIQAGAHSVLTTQAGAHSVLTI